MNRKTLVFVLFCVTLILAGTLAFVFRKTLITSYHVSQVEKHYATVFPKGQSPNVVPVTIEPRTPEAYALEQCKKHLGKLVESGAMNKIEIKFPSLRDRHDKPSRDRRLDFLVRLHETFENCKYYNLDKYGDFEVYAHSEMAEEWEKFLSSQKAIELEFEESEKSKSSE